MQSGWKSRLVRRGVISTIAAVLTIFATVVPAYAEGGFDSYISAWEDGDTSRVWPDRNLDNTNAYIKFVDCTSNPEVGVYRDSDDRRVASEIMWCLNTTDYFYFGDLPSNDYYFKVIDTRGGPLYVDTVNVRY
jgi:hypothetical protein